MGDRPILPADPVEIVRRASTDMVIHLVAKEEVNLQTTHAFYLKAAVPSIREVELDKLGIYGSAVINLFVPQLDQAIGLEELDASIREALKFTLT